MKKRTYTDHSIASSDITPEQVFLNRRALIKASAGTMAGALGAPSIAAAQASVTNTLAAWRWLGLSCKIKPALALRASKKWLFVFIG